MGLPGGHCRSRYSNGHFGNALHELAPDRSPRGGSSLARAALWPFDGATRRGGGAAGLVVALSLGVLAVGGLAPQAKATTTNVTTVAGAVCAPGQALAVALQASAVAADGHGGFYVTDSSDPGHSAVCHVSSTGAVAVP